MIPGRGNTAAVNGELIYAGNPELLSENGIFTEKEVREKAESYLQEGAQ